MVHVGLICQVIQILQLMSFKNLKVKIIMKQNMNKGFTLLELIMVTIILGVLAAVAVPRYMGSVSNAEEAAEASTIAALRLAVEQYANQKYLEEGRYSYPSNPFDYLEVDGYVGVFNSDEWVEEDWETVTDGSWYVLTASSWEQWGYITIWHRRGDDNIYGWTYYHSDHTDLDGDDRGSNVGLCAENPNDAGTISCDDYVYSSQR